MRGNHFLKHEHELGRRSIPACAGEPMGVSNSSVVQKVYPRVCGGTIPGCVSVIIKTGLSPRVRGNLAFGRCPYGGVRSIPACAGEPAPARPGAIAIDGLSPRVRGNPRGEVRESVAGWSIPACAGEPTGKTLLGRPVLVYPRVCGGTFLLAGTAAASSGLSPRVRGNRVRW